MSRPIDNELEHKILKAAASLLDKSGDQAVTMRAVAAMSGTAITTVYNRFESRESLLHRLAAMVAQQESAELGSAPTTEGMIKRYFAFCRAHPNRARLIVETFPARVSKGGLHPGLEVLKQRLASTLGGTPEKHRALALGLASLAQGVAGLMMFCNTEDQVEEFERAAFTTLKLALKGARSK